MLIQKVNSFQSELLTLHNHERGLFPKTANELEKEVIFYCASSVELLIMVDDIMV